MRDGFAGSLAATMRLRRVHTPQETIRVANPGIGEYGVV
jgi:hypothetical protein